MDKQRTCDLVQSDVVQREREREREDDNDDKDDKRMIKLTKKILPQYQFCKSSFFKGYNALHWLQAMLQKWRKTIHEGRETGVVMTDLFKAFNCIDQNLLIAKLIWI